MENFPIKSVTFGGFDKQDVIQYIERTSQEAADAQKALQEENGTLQEQLAALRQEAEALRGQVTELTAELNEEKAARQSLETLKPLKSELERLAAENQALRPDAEAYAQFREQIGAIECEARKRAADLEAATMSQLRGVVDQFRGQYQTMMSTFETTAAHVTSELRKVEVNLTQLPRAMDRSGAELNELAAMLEKREENT